MTPIYKLLSQKAHPAEECIVELAMHHIECAGIDLTQEMARGFLQLAVQVTEHNKGVLNKCLDLFSRLLALPVSEEKESDLAEIHIGVARELMPYVLRWLEGGDAEDRRPMDYWSLLVLLECMLVVLGRETQPHIPATLAERVCAVAGSELGAVVRMKGAQVVMQLARLTGHPSLVQWLSNCPFSFMVPPYERTHFTVYLCRVVPLFQDVPNVVRLMRIAITLIQPNQHYFNYLKNYEERLYLQGSDDAEIDAMHAHKQLIHPLGLQRTSMFAEFRTMLEGLRCWEEVRVALGSDVEVIRNIMNHEMVGSKVRRITKVRRP